MTVRAAPCDAISDRRRHVYDPDPQADAKRSVFKIGSVIDSSSRCWCDRQTCVWLYALVGRFLPSVHIRATPRPYLDHDALGMRATADEPMACEQLSQISRGSAATAAVDKLLKQSRAWTSDKRKAFHVFGWALTSLRSSRSTSCQLKTSTGALRKKQRGSLGPYLRIEASTSSGP